MQYRRETVRHKSGLNCRVTRGYCKNRRRVERKTTHSVCHGKISRCAKWKIHQCHHP